MKRLWPVYVVTALILHFPVSALFALPTGEIVEAGSAVFERPNESTLTIKAVDGTVINFNEFSIASNEIVNFYSFDPAAASNTNVLSRVIGSDISDIAGQLNAALNLFLVNPNGIHFAPTAIVKVNNLIASTLDIATNNFIRGNYLFARQSDKGYSQILNEGSITGDNIAMVASSVRNAGIVAASAGTMHMVSGDKVTVSFDQKGLIQVEINEQTSGSVLDLSGNSIKDALANSGTIEAQQVIMSARTASEIFENAVNQSGVVKATGMSQEGGVIRIRSNRNIQVSGSLQAPAGEVNVSSEGSIAVKADLNTVGNTKLLANKDIDVSSDITAVEGDLSLIADADLDGEGSFNQEAGTLISTINYGDILIQSSGESTLADIMSAGDLVLKKGGAAAIFTQHQGSNISTAGSMIIGQGVTLNAADTYYRIGKDLMNSGSFNPQNSRVELVSDQPSIIKGPITFNDLKVIVPGKKVSVTAGDMITIEGILTLQGSYGDLLTIVSTEPGIQWKILPLGNTDIAYSQIGDCFNARGPPLEAVHSISLGNNTNLELESLWTGQGLTLNWSDPDNWDSGIVPTQFDTVLFDGITGLYPNNNSFIDPDFSGSIANFIIDGYAGIVTLGRDLTITGDITLNSASLRGAGADPSLRGAEGDEAISLFVGGNWTKNGGTFDPGNFTVVFNDTSRSSLIAGNNTFYNFTCITPSKQLFFEAGKTTTILGALRLQGAYAQHVRLLSSEQGGQWYIDPQGPRDITYTWVEDSYNLDPAKVMMLESTNRGNCYNWDPTATWTGYINNLWSIPGNWIGLGGAAPGAGDDLVFQSGSSTLSTSNDYTAGTSFNSITITGSGYTLAGNSIILGAGGLTSNVIAGTNTISLDIALGATRTITVTNSDETLTISGIISGGAGVGLLKAGSGTLVLSGVNTYQGATAINAGTVSISADSGLGQAPGGATAGHLTFGGGTLLTTATFSLNSNRGIALGAGGGVLNISSATVLTYGGVIAGANALEKIGAGELILQGINTNSSTVTLNGGTFTLSGSDGTMASATFTVNQGVTLNLDNSTNGTNNLNRIHNTNALTLNGGEFIFRGTNTAATNATETVGALTLALGASTVTVFSGSGGSTVLIFDSVSRSVGTTVLFRGSNLGSIPAADNANINFTDPAGLDLTGGNGAVNTTTINIVPFALGDTDAGGAGFGFVTHNVDAGPNSYGIRPLDLANEYDNSDGPASNAQLNVRITASTFSPNVNRAWNSLILADGATYTVGTASTKSVTLTSNALLSSGSAANTLAGASARSWNAYGASPDNELMLFTIQDLTMSANILNTNTPLLTKSGAGNVTFTVVKAYTGATTINQGSIISGIAAAINSGSPITIAATGALVINNFALTANSFILYSGNTSGASITSTTGVLTLLAAGAGVTLNVNGAGSVGATITTTSTGTMALAVAGRTFTINDGTAENDLTVDIPMSGTNFGITKSGAGTLALIRANTYTGITTLNEGTLSVELMRNGGIASGIGASTNVATNFVLNGGTFKYTGATVSTNRLFTIGTTSPVTFDASGVGTLTFTGASMTLNGADTARTITFTGTGSAVLTNVIPDSGTGATTVVKNGSGTWTLNGVNTYTGTTTINAGTLKIRADSGLGTAPGAATPGHISLNGGMLQTTADFTLNSNRGIVLTAAGTIFVDISTTLTYAGVIAGANVLTKDGGGTLVLQGANTYSSATVINNGTLTFSGANGSALNSTSFIINSEGMLSLDNTSANNFDRIADGVEIIMYGGDFNFSGCSSVPSFETVGALKIMAGSNYVTVRDSTGGATVMTFSSFTRITGAMVLFRGTNLGNAPGSNVSTIMFTSAPALTGGGGDAGTTTVSIIQGAFGSGSPSGTGTDMVTYNADDNPFGMRLLNEGGFTGEYETLVLTVPDSNVKLSSSVAPGAGITINSLILASGGAVATSANTLTIASGNILALAGNNGINGSSVLAFGANPGIIRAVADLTISSWITGSAGLTTGGAGTITLSNSANSFTGGIRISQGTVKIAENDVLGAGSGADYITFFGGTLHTTADFTLDSNRGILLKGAGTIFTDPGTTLTYDGIITGPRSLIKDGTGLFLLGGTNTFAGDITVNAGSLTISAVNSYTGTTTINAGTLTFSGANGSAPYSSSFIINEGGTLTLDNTLVNNTNRIGNGSSVILNGGEFIFKGTNVDATNATETVGALILLLGDSTVTAFSGTGGQTVLTFDCISRDTGTTFLFRGVNLGSAPAAGSTNIIFTDDTDLALTGANTSALNKPIVPYAIGDTTTAGTGAGFVTYNINLADNNANTNGIRPLDLTTEYTVNVLTAGTNVRMSTASVNVAATAAINSLLLDGNSVNFNSSTAYTLTITSGALARKASGAVTRTGTTGTLAFGAVEAKIWSIAQGGAIAFTITPAMSGTAGLTKSGIGDVTLNTVAKALYGGYYINAGSVTTGVTNGIVNTNIVTVACTGTFVTSSTYTQTVTALVLYSGSASGAVVTTGTGTFTLLAAGSGVMLNVNGSGAIGATVSSTGAGQLALGAASRIFMVNDGDAADDLTVFNIVSGSGFGITKAGAGTLVLSGNNSYTGANIINGGTLAVTVNNALGTNAGNTTVNAGTIDFRNVAYGTTEGLILATGSKLITSTGTSSFAGNITMTALSMIEVEGTQLTLSGTIANGGFRLIVDGLGNTIISNTLTGTGGLAKQGTGTLTLSNTVTLAGNFSILRGTLILGSNTVTVSGNWTNNATFTCGTSTVTFNGGSSTIDAGGTGNGHDFYKVIINSTGTKTFAGATVITNVLQVDAGTLASDYNVMVQGGSVTSSGGGVINMTGGTFTVWGTGNFGGSTNAWTFYNLTFGNGSTSATTTKTGTNTINVTRQLEVKFNHTLQAGNSTTWNLVWTSYLVNITAIASGYDHTIALTQDGYVFAWGCNAYGQLGDGTTDDASTPVQVKAGEQGGEWLQGITKISAGGYHSVALSDDGSVFCWGYNEYGQLGNDSAANSSTPVQVHDLDNVGFLAGISKIAAGGFNTAVVSTTGFVYSWGYNGEGELGNDSIVHSSIPVQVLSGEQGGGAYLHDISNVAVGGSHMLALGIDGSVYSWGFNADGELGNGLTDDSHTPVKVLSDEQGGGIYLHNITKISAGDSHSLVLASTGFVYSWGYNGFGALGDDSTTDSSTPVQVLSGEQANGTYLQNVTDISAGAAHSLAIASGGYVFSWGRNDDGQLGNGLTADRPTPVKVLSGEQGSEIYLHGIAAIAAGGAQTVALSQARPVFNCGNNENGQLGNGFKVTEVEQIRVQAGSQAGPVIQLVVEAGATINYQTAVFNIYLSAVNYNNLTIYNTYQANYWLSGNTVVTGNLLIQDDATLSAGSYNITVSGNWTNEGGTFNAGTGTVTLNSSTQSQTVTSGGSAFHILTITNSYVDGVIFADRLVTDYLNAVNGVQKLSFSAESVGAPHTITTSFNVSGSAGHLLELAPIVPYTTWYLDAPTTTNLHHLKVGYSHLADGKSIYTARSESDGGNTNWTIGP